VDSAEAQARAGRAAVLLIALVLLGLVGMALLMTRGGLFKAVELRGERGVSQGGAALLTPGERVRLELDLRRPAAVLVYLQDPAGAFSEVHPPPGEAPVIEGGRVRLPPAGDAWETAGLGPGAHTLWIIALGRAISPAEREAITTRLGKELEPDRSALLAFLGQRLATEEVQMATRRFWVE